MEDLIRIKEKKVKAALRNNRSFRISSSRSEVFSEGLNQSYDPGRKAMYQKSLEHSLEKVPINADRTDINMKAEKIGLFNLKRLRVKNKDLFKGLFEKRDIERMKVMI